MRCCSMLRKPMQSEACTATEVRRRASYREIVIRLLKVHPKSPQPLCLRPPPCRTRVAKLTDSVAIGIGHDREHAYHLRCISVASVLNKPCSYTFPLSTQHALLTTVTIDISPCAELYSFLLVTFFFFLGSASDFSPSTPVVFAFLPFLAVTAGAATTSSSFRFLSACFCCF